jgi:type II secretory pathway component GspD/PulD (secretin)
MRTHIPRRFWLVALAWLLFVKLTVLAAPVTTDPKAVPPSPADKARKLLDQSVTIEFAEQPLSAALAQLSEQTKLKFALDRLTIAQMGLGDPDMPVTAKMQDTKLRSALRNILGQYHLSYVLIEDSVLVTTEEMALYRQMRQRVDVDLREVPLQQALAQVARSSGTNLVLDPRVAKEAKTAPLSLQLDDVPLETAVRIIAEMAGLKSVRLGNVLFVTTEERAEKLRAEPESRPPLPGGGYAPDGTAPPPVGGFAPAMPFPIKPPMAFPVPVPAQPGLPAPAPPEKEAPPQERK